jgi:hypothetical protein
MDWNRIEGNWKSAKGQVKEKWGQLTDNDLAQIVDQWSARSASAAKDVAASVARPAPQ